MKSVMLLKLASSINSRNATRVAEDVSPRGDIFVVIAVGRLVSMLGGAQVLFFDLLWCFLLLGPISCWQKLIPYP
jgi:hypothetical protein